MAVSVQLKEHYENFAPPRGFHSSVDRLLRALDAQDLAGLGGVLLTNVEALGRSRRRQKTWTGGKKVTLSDCPGWYQPAWGRDPAWIEILVDRTVQHIPNSASRFPPLRTLAIATLLYHEVGHHIHATRRPEHGDPEVPADRWARDLTRSFFRRRYGPLGTLFVRIAGPGGNRWPDFLWAALFVGGGALMLDSLLEQVRGGWSWYAAVPALPLVFSIFYVALHVRRFRRWPRGWS